MSTGSDAIEKERLTMVKLSFDKSNFRCLPVVSGFDVGEVSGGIWAYTLPRPRLAHGVHCSEISSSRIRE